MEFFCFFLILGSIFGCFPANIRFLMGKEPFTPLKYRHYCFSLLFILLMIVQAVEFSNHMGKLYLKLKTSEKLSLMLATITYVVSDTYFRLYGVIYGHKLSLLINDLRMIKHKFREMQGNFGSDIIVRLQDRKWFTFGTALGLTLQYIHVPLRVYDWHTNRDFYEIHKTSIFYNDSVIYPLFIMITELGGMICRSFAVAIIVSIGLELLESYKILNAWAEKQTRNMEASEETEFNHKSKARRLLLDPKVNEESSDESLLQQFLKIQSCFHRFNQILGSFAFIILTWATGNMLMEIRALPTEDRNEIGEIRGIFDVRNSVTNDLASIVGTVFGLVVIFLICFLGHRIEFAVRKHKERMTFLGLQDHNGQFGKVSKCLSAFKWEFTAKGLFVINLSLIPKIAGAVFSITIFHLQLEISERKCPFGGQASNSTSDYHLSDV